MWIRYFLVMYAFFCVAFVCPKFKEKSNVKFFCLLIPVFVVAACRGNGDGDYFNYINRGQYINNWHDVLFKDIGMEIGYKVLAYIIKILLLPRQAIIIAMNFITVICLSKFVKKYSLHWTMSILLFLPLFFMFEMHAARTGVAIAIVSLGYKYIQERNLVKYIGIIVLASLFHSTAIIAIFLYFLYMKEIKLNQGLLIIGIEVLLNVFVSYDKIMQFMLRGLHLNVFLKKYLIYANSERFGYAISILDPRIIIVLVVYVTAVLMIKEKNDMDRLFTNGVFMCAFLLILFNEHTFMAYRFSSYYYYSLLIVVPNIIEKNKNEIGVKRILFYLIILLFSILNMVYAMGGVEYIPFWENKIATMPWG